MSNASVAQDVFGPSIPSSSASLRTPWYKVWIGKPPLTGEIGSSLVSMSGIGVLDQELFNQRIEEVTVEDTIGNADQWSIKVLDPEQEFMFDEMFYLGQSLYINYGYVRDHELRISGFISSLEYDFSIAGIPELVIKGFGLDWNSLSGALGHGDEHAWSVWLCNDLSSIGNVAPDPRSGGKLIYTDMKQMFDAFALYYGLQVEWDKSIPLNVQQRLYPQLSAPLQGFGNIPALSAEPVTGTYNFPLPTKATGTAYAFLDSLRPSQNWVFMVKNRTIYFYPDDFTQDIIATAESVSSTQGKSIKSAYKTRTPVFWYKCDSYPPGSGYNMLSFTPSLMDFGTAGFLGASVDPKTGKISYAGNTNPESLRSSLAANTPAAATNPLSPANIMVKNSDGSCPTPYLAVTNRDDVTDYISSNMSGNKPDSKIIPVNLLRGNAGKGNDELSALANFSFKDSMHFVSAKAVVLGDVHLTCAIPVYVYGFGHPSDVNAPDPVQIRRSGKVCGKWFCYSVKHVLKANASYTCELDLRRWFQFYGSPPIPPEAKTGLEDISSVLKGLNPSPSG